GYLFTFPLFMFTYLPVAVAAVFKDTGWKPITHSVTAVSEICTDPAMLHETDTMDVGDLYI
ncbi:MAG: hypothetical protein IIY83_07540, partial [Lachnospiraceae bacterium]|nr:hypothetical protein [Lachnospiraceae bacterium]